MKYSEALENLCYYDKRNPEGYYAERYRFLWEDDDEIIEPRLEICYCDNCFYGRDELALEIISLVGELNTKSGLK